MFCCSFYVFLTLCLRPRYSRLNLPKMDCLLLVSKLSVFNYLFLLSAERNQNSHWVDAHRKAKKQNCDTTKTATTCRFGWDKFLFLEMLVTQKSKNAQPCQHLTLLLSAILWFLMHLFFTKNCQPQKKNLQKTRNGTSRRTVFLREKKRSSLSKSPQWSVLRSWQYMSSQGKISSLDRSDCPDRITGQQCRNVCNHNQQKLKTFSQL